MESSHLGYKDEKYEQKAKEVRENVKLATEALKNRQFDLLSNYTPKIEENSRELAKYLRNMYPNKFMIHNYEYDILTPEYYQYSGSLSDAPEIARNVWNAVKEKGYKPQLHDLIIVDVSNNKGFKVYKLRFNPYLYFIGDEDIYVQINVGSDKYAPDEFYYFMERMGLTENMQRYIYEDDYIDYKPNLWPKIYNEMEKL
jgi:hypothetical protein